MHSLFVVFLNPNSQSILATTGSFHSTLPCRRTYHKRSPLPGQTLSRLCKCDALIYTSCDMPLHTSSLCSWVDVDTRGSVPAVPGYPTPNRIWYRIPSAPAAADILRVTADVAASFRKCSCLVVRKRDVVPNFSNAHPLAANETSFVPTVVSVFTWFAVGRYNSGTDRLNTFQAVLASSPGERSH